MMSCNILTQELLSAIKHISEKCKSSNVRLIIDGKGRLLVSANDLAGNTIEIKLFDAETQKFPEITKTERFEL